MLKRLLTTYLYKYRWLLGAVVGLQLVQTMATLYLPSLNANIIDKGIARGDHGYIWRTGILMLAITVVQIGFSISAVYFGSKTAMGFGRDVRGGLFHRVTDYSTQEVNLFGAPSLITRITNDVQQVQMLVLMTCTLLVAAPITIIGGTIMALREDVGLSGILLFSIPALTIGVGLVISRMIPQFRLMQIRIDGINRVLREQITGIRVVRAFVREPDEAKRFKSVNRDVAQDRATDGLHVPAGLDRTERVERGRAVDRCQPDQLRCNVDRRADRLPQLSRPDPDVGDDGQLHGRHDPTRLGVRRADPRGARHAIIGALGGRSGDLGGAEGLARVP